MNTAQARLRTDYLLKLFGKCPMELACKPILNLGGSLSAYFVKC